MILVVVAAALYYEDSALFGRHVRRWQHDFRACQRASLPPAKNLYGQHNKEVVAIEELERHTMFVSCLPRGLALTHLSCISPIAS